MSFSSFQNILPDPNNTIGEAGQAAGTAGPGFATVSLTSEQPTMKDFTNGGRLLARAIASHAWKIKIGYNPLTQTEFDRIYTFLLHRRGSINPFFVSLPQYRTPRDANFATYSTTPSNKLEVLSNTNVFAGATSGFFQQIGYNFNTNGTPTPGDLFTVEDSANSNHLKAYMVTRVETNSNYLNTAAQPGVAQLRIHFTPGASKTMNAGAKLVFHNPLIKVISTRDIQQYALNTDNLYSYSLDLREVQ
tara:strand:- start:5870 stop:6610 length:741 start_codon:yes stop_codon:yes gene_type:complete